VRPRMSLIDSDVAHRFGCRSSMMPLADFAWPGTPPVPFCMPQPGIRPVRAQEKIARRSYGYSVRTSRNNAPRPHISSSGSGIPGKTGDGKLSSLPSCLAACSTGTELANSPFPGHLIVRNIPKCPFVVCRRVRKVADGLLPGILPGTRAGAEVAGGAGGTERSAPLSQGIAPAAARVQRQALQRPKSSTGTKVSVITRPRAGPPRARRTSSPRNLASSVLMAIEGMTAFAQKRRPVWRNR
jgi:hypothetical protein